MPDRVLRGIALIALAALGACSSNTAQLPSVGKRQMVAARFTMHWPSRHSRGAQSGRRPLYISPNTQSVVVEVNNDPTLTTIANNPTLTGAPPTTTVPINAPAGVDTFYFATWDGPDGKGSQLGQIQVTQTITAGVANAVNATVDGILTFIGVSAAPNQPYFEQSADASGNATFSLVGDQKAMLSIVPLDADKNTIIPPGNAPNIAMSSSDPSIVVAPVAGQANQYTASAAMPTTTGVQPVLRVSGADGLGNTVNGQYDISELAAIYVGYQGFFQPGSASILVYDQQGKLLPTSGAFAGVGLASGMAYDPDDHLIFVADNFNNMLEAFDSQGNAAAGFTPASFAGARSVTYDGATKQVYLTSDTSNTIGVFTVMGAAVTVAGPFAGLSNPTGISYDSKNNQLYVANSGANANITVYNGDGTAGSPVAIQPSIGFTPYAIAYDGNLADAIFLTGSFSRQPTLAKFGTQGNFLGQSTLSNNAQKFGMAYNAVNGEIYITNDAFNGSVTGYTDAMPPAQDMTVFAQPNTQIYPFGITAAF